MQRASGWAAGCRRATRRRSGFTLVELMIVVTVAALLGAISLPSMAGLLGRHRLQAAAHQLQADLALARQEALRRGQTAHLVLHPGAHWCYALSLGVARDCRSPSGTGGAALAVVRADRYPEVVLLQAATMTLDARDGTSLQGQGRAEFASARGERLTVQLSHLGRASLCTPAAPIAGIAGCRPG